MCRATDGAVLSGHPPIALQMSSRPPVRTRPAKAGIGSTWSRMSAFSAVADRYPRERISAAAPATCGDAIEPPLMYPYAPPRSVE